jgi:predicted dehydrogenase
MKQIRLAVIGAGLIGRTHLALIRDNPHCQLVAVCDANPGALATAEEYGVRFYQDYTRLLAEQSLDGVIVATPTALHAEVGIACTEHGLHLLIEKPIAATLKDAAALVATAKRHDVQILVGHHRRHNPLVQAAREVVRSGAIGRLVAVSAHWMLQKPADYFDVDWRHQRPAGGPALINLIHDVDNLRYICGEVEQVFALTSSATRGFAVEDTLAINLTFANGALATILATDTTPAPWSYELTTGENPAYPQVDENCYHFCGTAGALAFPQMALWRYPDETQSGWMHSLEKSTMPVSPANPLVAQLAHFCQVIGGQATPLVSGEDAAKSLAVVLAILDSAETQRPSHPTRLFLQQD